MIDPTLEFDGKHFDLGPLPKAPTTPAGERSPRGIPSPNNAPAVPMICVSLPSVERFPTSNQILIWHRIGAESESFVRLHNRGDRLQITVARGALPDLNYSLPGYPGGSVSTAIWVPSEDYRPAFMAIGDRGTRLDGIWNFEEDTIEVLITSDGDPLGPSLLLESGAQATIDQSMTLLRIELANQVRLGMESSLAARAAHALALAQDRARKGNVVAAADSLRVFTSLWSERALEGGRALERIPREAIRRQFVADAAEILKRLMGCSEVVAFKSDSGA